MKLNFHQPLLAIGAISMLLLMSACGKEAQESASEAADKAGDAVRESAEAAGDAVSRTEPNWRSPDRCTGLRVVNVHRHVLEEHRTLCRLVENPGRDLLEVGRATRADVLVVEARVEQLLA